MKIWLKVLLTLFILGIIAAASIWIFIINKPHKDIEKAKVAYSLPAKELFESYKKDKKTADSVYNDKVLEISGSLDHVDTANSAVTAVFVFERDEMFGDNGVRCTMIPKFKSEILNVKKGTILKIKGQCKGFTDDVILEHCALEK